MKKLLTLVLSISLLVSSSVCTVFSISSDDIDGASKSSTIELSLPDGTDTGVYQSHLSIPQGTTYNNTAVDKEAYFIEFNLANTNLSVDVINCGDYMASATTVSTAVDKYNTQNPDKTVLAAMNGDLWMTKVHSNPDITKNLLKVSRGIMISDGEIWASQQIGMENASATNAEKGTSTPLKAAFGVTDENQPVMGTPEISVNIANLTKNSEISADGINRLPADNSIIVFNHRCFSSNYALDDSFEVVLKTDNSAFSFKAPVQAEVVSICKSGSTNRPEIDKNTVVITVRGDKIADVENAFAIGDKVTFECSITDSISDSKLWENAVSVIGGHMMVFAQDRLFSPVSGSSEYPTSLIGIKDDGSVLFTTVSAAQDKSYKGLNFKDAINFCTQAGYNSVFYLDGGGSTTLVSLQDGEYSVRNHCSDGSARAVINSVAVVWNENPVCDKQGDLSHIKIAVDLSEFPACHIPADLLPELVGAVNHCSGKYDSSLDEYIITATQDSIDINAIIDFSSLEAISADDYKYVVFKIKTDFMRMPPLGLFYFTGSVKGPTPNCLISTSFPASKSWQYLVVDMSSKSNWTGKVNGFRFDPFDNYSTPKGTTVSIGGITLCKTLDEAENVSDGILPDGAIKSYQDYMDAHKPAPSTPKVDTTSAPTETISETVVVSETISETVAETESSTITDVQTTSISEQTEKTSSPNSTKSGCGVVTGSGSSGFIVLSLCMFSATVLSLNIRKNIKKKKC